VSNNPFLLYPNPSKGQVTIEKLPTNATIAVLNLMGQKLEMYHSSASSIDLDLSYLASGTYLLQLNDTHCVKLLIE
jgi:allantoicase